MSVNTLTGCPRAIEFTPIDDGCKKTNIPPTSCPFVGEEAQKKRLVLPALQDNPDSILRQCPDLIVRFATLYHCYIQAEMKPTLVAPILHMLRFAGAGRGRPAFVLNWEGGAARARPPTLDQKARRRCWKTEDLRITAVRCVGVHYIC